MNKALYWLITIPTRYLAAFGGAVVLLLLVSVFAMTRGASANNNPTTPGSTAVAQGTSTGATATPDPILVIEDNTPTPVAGPSFGGTIDLSDWTISLARMETRACVVLNETDGSSKVDKQTHYLLWVDAKNNSQETRTLRRTVGWALHTEEDHVYYARPDQDLDSGESGAWVTAEGRDYLATEVPPGGVVHPLLAFRTFNFRPLQLVVNTVEANPTTIAFDLTGADVPTPAAASPDCQ